MRRVEANKAEKEAEKMAREADKAEEARRKVEEKALVTAKRHAEKAREKASAALEAAKAATAKLNTLNALKAPDGGADNQANGRRATSTNIANTRLRRASSRFMRLPMRPEAQSLEELESALSQTKLPGEEEEEEEEEDPVRYEGPEDGWRRASVAADALAMSVPSHDRTQDARRELQ